MIFLVMNAKLIFLMIIYSTYIWLTYRNFISWYGQKSLKIYKYITSIKKPMWVFPEVKTFFYHLFNASIYNIHGICHFASIEILKNVDKKYYRKIVPTKVYILPTYYASRYSENIHILYNQKNCRIWTIIRRDNSI